MWADEIFLHLSSEEAGGSVLSSDRRHSRTDVRGRTWCLIQEVLIDAVFRISVWAAEEETRWLRFWLKLHFLQVYQNILQLLKVWPSWLSVNGWDDDLSKQDIKHLLVLASLRWGFSAFLFLFFHNLWILTLFWDFWLFPRILSFSQNSDFAELRRVQSNFLAEEGGEFSQVMKEQFTLQFIW